MAKQSFISPPFAGIHPWINNPDTKYNKDGLFHVKGIIEPGEAQDLHRKRMDDAAQAAFEDMTKDMTPAQKKKAVLYVPYEMEEDDEGNPTRNMIVEFKQNATIKLKDGSTKKVRIGVVDSQDNPTKASVFGGDIIRVMYTLRPIKIASTNAFGVRADFAQVQIVRKGEGGTTRKFGAVDGGFVGAGSEDAPNDAPGQEADY